MKETIIQQDQYDQNYCEILFLEKVRFLCGCCCKNKDWYKQRVKKLERHENAVAALTEEFDVVKHIKGERVTDFLAKISLKRYHRALVASFSRYQVADLRCEMQK